MYAIYFCFLAAAAALSIEELCNLDGCQYECFGEVAISAKNFLDLPEQDRSVNFVQIFGYNFLGSISVKQFQLIYPNLKALDLRGSGFTSISCEQAAGLNTGVIFDCYSTSDPNIVQCPGGYSRGTCCCLGVSYEIPSSCPVEVFEYKQ